MVDGPSAAVAGVASAGAALADTAVGDAATFGTVVLLVALAATVAVASNRLTEWLRVPAPLLFLVAAAAVSAGAPSAVHLSMTAVQRIVTVALVVILFDGGMHIGWRRFRSAAGPIVAVGVVGTVLTAAAVGALAHGLFGFSWLTALLLGTALAPTDPAVVFSVLGRREIAGRSGVLLEGESGANDPVGIALLASLLAAGSGGIGEVAGATAGRFALEMAVGAAIGVGGGGLLLWAMRRLPLPSEGLYPLRTLAGAFIVYGLATVAHGSGFLAVLVAGILVGDAHAPYKGEITRFHSALASLGEIVAFGVLGLTVDAGSLTHDHAWLTGLVLALLLAFVVRPLLVGPLLLAVDLTRGERVLVMWSGLKGAVPILLGTYLVTGGVARAGTAYDVVLVVVAFSVLVQGGLVPWVAERCRVPMRMSALEPWALGIRFRDEPQGLRRHTVRAGSPAHGRSVGELDLGESVWVSLLIRGGRLVPVAGETVLQPDDEVVLLVDPDGGGDPAHLFRRPAGGAAGA